TVAVLDARKAMKAALAIAAAVVAAAVITLWLALGSDEPAVDPAFDRAPHVAKITQAEGGNPARDGSPTPSAIDTPPAASPRAMQPDAPRTVTDYMVGGVRVRDHRSGDRTPSAIPPAIHPPGGRKI